MQAFIQTTVVFTMALGLGCSPLSTRDLGSQESAIEAQGQLAQQEQTGTVGKPAYSELEANTNMVQDPFDPDPFIQARTQELASREDEGTEVPIAEPEGIGTNPVGVDPAGNIGEP
jgi:hypothetical protein